MRKRLTDIGSTSLRSKGSSRRKLSRVGLDVLTRVSSSNNGAADPAQGHGSQHPAATRLPVCSAAVAGLCTNKPQCSNKSHKCGSCRCAGARRFAVGGLFRGLLCMQRHGYHRALHWRAQVWYGWTGVCSREGKDSRGKTLTCEVVLRARARCAVQCRWLQGRWFPGCCALLQVVCCTPAGGIAASLQPGRSWSLVRFDDAETGPVSKQPLTHAQGSSTQKWNSPRGHSGDAAQHL